MNKRIRCSECGANIILGKVAKNTCNYCGSLLDLNNAKEVEMTSDVSSAANNALAFQKSLIAEVNGQSASIVEMWQSLVSNRNVPKEKLFNFFKNLKTRINFCIEAYQNMSDEVKYEVGDFICEQMVSMIRFKIKNNINYLEELDEIDSLIKKQQYDFKARGLIQIKAKIVIWKRIRRIQARRAVLLYDYVIQAIEEITKEYNSKIEPLKSELSATAATAFSIRKNLKEKIESLELAKKREIDALGSKNATKEYNKYVKKFKIEHDTILEEPIEEFVPVAASNGVANNTPAIDYSSMSSIELIDALNDSIKKLNEGVTRGESDTCKAIKSALEARSLEMTDEERMYLNAIIMSVNMIFSNEQPAVMSAMIKNVSGNISMQSNNLKAKLIKK